MTHRLAPGVEIQPTAQSTTPDCPNLSVISTRSTDGDELLCHPLRLEMRPQLNRTVCTHFTLTNVGNQPFAFKIRTTNPTRYRVKPTIGFVTASSAVVCTIAYIDVASYPDPQATRDKFLVQSVHCGPPSNIPNLTLFWRERESLHAPHSGRFAYSEQKIICKILTKQRSTMRNDCQMNDRNSCCLPFFPSFTSLKTTAQQTKRYGAYTT